VNEKMANKDYTKIIKDSLKEDTGIIGTKETIKLLKQGQISTVFLTVNAPESVKKEIKTYSKMSETEVIDLDVPNNELGTVCRKPFAISVYSIKK